MLKNITKKYPKLCLFLGGGLAGALILFLNHASAITFTTAPITPETNQQVGALSIATSTAASTLQINASSTFAGVFINQAAGLPAGPILDAVSNNVLRFRITRTGEIGIATSSPAAPLSVQGNALISGTTTVGALVATGTAILGPAQLRMPVTDGTNGQVMQTNGSGQLSFSNKGDWNILGQTVVSAATTSMMVRNLTPVRNIMIEIMITSRSAGLQESVLKFNEDSAANYGYNDSVDFGVLAGANNGVNFIDLKHATAQPIYTSLWVSNATGTRKLGFGESIKANATGSTAPGSIEHMFVWNDTTNAINTVEFRSNATETFGAGSRLTIWGTNTSF